VELPENSYSDAVVCIFIRYSIFLAVFFDTNIKYNANTQIDKGPLPPEILTTFGFAWSTIPFLLVFCVFHQNCNHGGRQSNTTQTLAQWRHPVASREALVVLHWAMRPALHQPISMVIKIASNFPASFCIIDFVFSHNHSLKPCYSHSNIIMS
jgi:hypothetical protein